MAGSDRVLSLPNLNGNPIALLVEWTKPATDGMANRTGQPGDIARDTTTKADIRRNPMALRLT